MEIVEQHLFYFLSLHSSVANSPSLASVSQTDSRKISSNSRSNHIMAVVPAPKYSTASMREHLLQQLARNRDRNYSGGELPQCESEFGSREVKF